MIDLEDVDTPEVLEAERRNREWCRQKLALPFAEPTLAELSVKKAPVRKQNGPIVPKDLKPRPCPDGLKARDPLGCKGISKRRGYAAHR